MTILKEAAATEPAAFTDRPHPGVEFDWTDREKSRPSRSARARTASSALFMSETIDGLNAGAHFLDRLSAAEQARVHAAGRTITVPQGDMVFSQGDGHDGIFIIRRGQVRVYYTAPSGREITLAYWTPGHFIGGPEISGGGIHMWSGIAIEACEISALSGPALEKLLTGMPRFAAALTAGPIAKRKCYSPLAAR